MPDKQTRSDIVSVDDVKEVKSVMALMLKNAAVYGDPALKGTLCALISGPIFVDAVAQFSFDGDLYRAMNAIHQAVMELSGTLDPELLKRAFDLKKLVDKARNENENSPSPMT